MADSDSQINALPDRNSPATLRRQARRARVDRLVAVLMAVGGIGVIVAVLLIFIYLLLVVLPIFAPARLLGTADHPEREFGPVAAMTVDEYGSHATLVTREGQVHFVNLATGAALPSPTLPLDGVAVTSVSSLDAPSGVFALGLADGRALVLALRYTLTYVGDVRQVAPQLEYPLGEAPVVIDESGGAIEAIAIQGDEAEFLIAADLPEGRGALVQATKSESLLDETVEVSTESTSLELPDYATPNLLLDPARQNLYAQVESGAVLHFDTRDAAAPELLGRVGLTQAPAAISSLRLLAGGLSLMVGDTTGKVTQWFSIRDASNKPQLTAIRSFNFADGGIQAIAPEPARKGFAAWAGEGGAARVHLAHTTAERQVLEFTSALPSAAASADARPLLAFSTHAEHLVSYVPGQGVRLFDIDNPHPEISLRSLWLPVWYESRQAPDYIWQSSSASDDFEPKFSLVPLTFGTLKGALYAMILAVPLAIMGAIYTGYFMSHGMRRTVKPVIEVMAALPTVILGFLAGLWLAPLVESALPGVLSSLLLLPIAVLLTAWAWQRLPEGLRARLPDSIEVLVLVPVICATVAFCMGVSPWVEATYFGGDTPGWLTRNLGLGFDQRNSLVVGIAMGFAIIPNIFSIAEDAVFGVPKHLTVGSLALGATPWQTLTRVVLLTASPGIFSGVMIGFGRAVGETMIVLMATGNTPIMSMNVFQGFRALSANVATEMPESAVNSTHFRVLFLAALVLFVVTFLFNTLAELVRSRLRARYSTL